MADYIFEYENYHKHDNVSNIFTPDTHIHTIDYINRIKELGYGDFGKVNKVFSKFDKNIMQWKKYHYKEKLKMKLIILK